jgi:DNA-directed RNA polymerase specialized sigma24 family protein
MEGLSSKEVADIVGCRESTVRNHLFNARRVLRAS